MLGRFFIGFQVSVLWIHDCMSEILMGKFFAYSRLVAVDRLCGGSSSSS